MDNIYQYETNEDILIAKYMFHKDPVSCLFFENENLIDYFLYIDDC